MAVDTKEKRMNAAGVGRPWMRSKLPGANDQAWRIASGNGYGGNTIASSITEGLQWTTASGPLEWTTASGPMEWTATAGLLEWTIGD
jgi:hypothetical protein